MSLVTDLLKWTGKNLASGAVSDIGGLAVGGLLKAMGLGQDDGVAALGAQLDQVQSALAQIQGELDEIWKDIDAQLKEIEQEQLYISWQNRDELMQQYITQSLAQYNVYLEYINAPTTTTPEEIDALVRDIENTNTGPVITVAQISSALCGTSAGDKGVLQLWSEMTVPLLEAGTMHYSQAVQSYCDYYGQATYAQFRATNLLIEAYNKDKNRVVASEKWDEYRRALLTQEDVFMTYLVPLIKAGLVGSTHTHSRGYGYEFVQALLDAFPGVSGVPIFYQPSPAYAQAEELLAALYVTQAKDPTTGKAVSDRRIVVHMICNQYNEWGGDPIPDVRNAPITLTDSQRNIHNAQLAQTLNAPNYEVIRFVFSNLEDDTYRLTDLNGGDYKPIHMSNDTEPVQFQDARFLNYQLIVNEVTQAAFMNFTAYQGPQPSY